MKKEYCINDHISKSLGKPYTQQPGREVGRGAGHIVTPAEKLAEAQALSPVEGRVYNYENADMALAKIKSEINAPYFSGQVSTLGGKESASILFSISLENPKTWSGGYIENSNYGKFHLLQNGELENFTGRWKIPTNFRKTRVKSIDEAIAKLNKFLQLQITTPDPTLSTDKEVVDIILSLPDRRSADKALRARKIFMLGGPTRRGSQIKYSYLIDNSPENNQIKFDYDERGKLTRLSIYDRTTNKETGVEIHTPFEDLVSTPMKEVASGSLPGPEAFAPALDKFIAETQKMIDEHYKKNYASLSSPKITAMVGTRYVRIVSDNGHQRSAFCFIDKATGDILKTAGWNAPAKHARGNIYDSPDIYMKRITPYGAAYLKSLIEKAIGKPYSQQPGRRPGEGPGHIVPKIGEEIDLPGEKMNEEEYKEREQLKEDLAKEAYERKEELRKEPAVPRYKEMVFDPSTFRAVAQYFSDQSDSWGFYNLFKDTDKLYQWANGKLFAQDLGYDRAQDMIRQELMDWARKAPDDEIKEFQAQIFGEVGGKRVMAAGTIGTPKDKDPADIIQEILPQLGAEFTFASLEQAMLDAGYTEKDAADAWDWVQDKYE